MSSILEPELDVRLPDRYEVVDGEIVELPPMSGYASEVANVLRDELNEAARRSKLGRARNDMLFRIPTRRDPNRNRRPDVAFVSYERWPKDVQLPYRTNPVNFVPDLVVEVASPTDFAEELEVKAEEYLQAGVRLVWIVFPLAQTVHVYNPPNATDVRRVGQQLEGGSVLPGFSVAIADLFPNRSDEDD